jgi:hypothetical protein
MQKEQHTNLDQVKYAAKLFNKASLKGVKELYTSHAEQKLLFHPNFRDCGYCSLLSAASRRLENTEHIYLST